MHRPTNELSAWVKRPFAYPGINAVLSESMDMGPSAITGADPVPKESRGKLKEMTAAWVKWGIEKGYIE